MNGEELLRVIEQLDDKIINEAETYETLQMSKKISWRHFGSLVACLIVCFLAANVLGSLMIGFPFTNGDSNKNDIGMHSNLSGDSSQENCSDIVEEVAEGNPHPETAGVTMTDGTEREEVAGEETSRYENLIGDSSEVIDEEISGLEVLQESAGDFIVIQSYWNHNLPEVKYVMPEKGSYYYFVQLEDALIYYEGQENIKYYVEIYIFGDYLDDNNQLVYGELTGAERKNNEQVQTQVQEEGKRLQDLGYEVELEENILQGYLTRQELETFPIEEQYGYTFKFKNE